MIDLRFLNKNGRVTLQWRQVRCEIGWSKSDDRPVIQPATPLSFNTEENWTEWEDVRLEGDPLPSGSMGIER
jgi:hypothetical protein